MHYRRMSIEVESPEQLGYERIRNNLAESSIADGRLGDLGLALDDLILQYGDHRGDVRLRSAIASDARAQLGGTGVRPDDVLLTPGAAGALFIVATTLLEPGAHLIVARPNYATNLETPRAIGAHLETLDLSFDAGWRVDPERIAAMLRPETRLVSLTSPHNPTGQVIEADELRAIVELVERHGQARLLLDETYRDMTYGTRLPPVATLSDRAIGVSSLSKAYGLPGIRTGWLTTRDRGLMDRFLAAKEQMLITGSVVDEAIAAAAYGRRSQLLPGIGAGIGAALATTSRWMASQAIFEWVEPRGGVVGFPRIRPEVDLDTDRFYARLFEVHGTVVGPGHWFEQPDTSYRLGYGWPEPSSLEAGLASLSAAAEEVIGART